MLAELVKPIVSGTSNLPNPSNLVASAGRVFFTAAGATPTRPSHYGVELWTSDGTDAGTLMVRDINPSLTAGSDPTQLVVAPNEKLYFTAEESSGNRELWIYDATADGRALNDPTRTRLVKDIRANSGSNPTALVQAEPHSTSSPMTAPG